MTMMASKRSTGDKLVVKSENPKRRKVQEVETDSPSASEDDSLSETSSASSEDESERNPTALKPIKETGVEISDATQDGKPKAKVCICSSRISLYIYFLDDEERSQEDKSC